MKKAHALSALALLLALLLCPLFVVAQEQSEEILPAPLVDDRVGVLSPSTIQRIERDGAVLRDLTGVEPVVVTVEFLGGKSISDYACDLFDARQIGAAQNNGLLLLLCIGEEDYHLLAGKGLEQAFSADALLSILDACMEVDFEAGEYDAGTRRTFDRLLSETERFYAVSVAEELALREAAAAAPPTVDYRWLVPVVFLLLACLMFTLSCARRRRRRRVA